MVPVILADRGDCPITQKVINMEDAGAAIGIIIDNTNESIENLVMADDGNGAGIRIPSMLISKSDGAKITDFLKTASAEQLAQVVVLNEFVMGRPDNRVEYDIWYSSSHNRALDFISDFAPVDELFDDSVLMTPHFKFWTCRNCDKTFKKNHCMGDGKYCGTSVKNAKGEKVVSGVEVIMEDLRQKCIYQNSYNEQNPRTQWWKYIKVLHEECYGAVNQDCSKEAHKLLGMKYNDTLNCVKDQFEIDGSKVSIYSSEHVHSPNLVVESIEEEMAYDKAYGAKMTPAVVINNITFRGQLEVEAVFSAICSGFADTPSFCQKYLETNEWNKPELVIMQGTFQRKHTFLRVFMICVGIMAMVGVVLMCYRRSARREMQTVMKDQVESAVNQYLALSNRDTEASGRAQESELRTEN